MSLPIHDRPEPTDHFSRGDRWLQVVCAAILLGLPVLALVAPSGAA